MLRFFRPRGGVPVPTFRLKNLQHLLLAAALFSASSALPAQDKRASSATFKIGFLMDSLKIERWQTDLDRFQKRSEEHTSELQSRPHLVCRLLLEKKKN